MKKLFLFSSLGFSALLNAQILDVTPAFPTQNDDVTIIYDASQGNGALDGVTTVYAHTGVITTQSTSPTNWQFVQGNWGTADADVLMTSLGNNLFEISFNIADFYNFPAGTEVLQLAFVFRNASGNIVGRSADGSDIYYNVYPENSGLLGKIFSPEVYVLENPGTNINIVAKSNENATLTLEDISTSTLLTQEINATELDYDFAGVTPGEHWIKFTADNGTDVVTDSVFILINQAPNVAALPSGLLQGLNRITIDSVAFRLFAPEKSNVYLIGDFNDWTPSLDYQMNLTPDGTTWWLGVGNLDESVRYGYQYLVDGQAFADPYSELISDPWSDGSIPSYAYPDPYEYPIGQTTGFISLFESNPEPYNWQVTDFQKPAQEKLVIYELLVRDFIAKHDYQTIIDTLDYLENLGVNAIELMPVNEFENNESWGYNPSFHMALDKYYGTPNDFKAFVDACHQRGIAVIQDVVLNHAFGQSPMVRMYWDASINNVASNSPWFNQSCPHEPFCWGWDYNHEAQAVKDFIDRVNLYWLDEFKVDGFRFDFTKGFVNSSALYSTTRINNLKRMADTIWSVHPDAYVTLEHFCDNNEETELANYGMMLWGNITHDYHNAIKGFSSNLNWGLHSSRGWDSPHLISYIESHDEQRGMYEALTNGSSVNPNHNVKDLNTALSRTQTAAVLMLLTQGPKLIWQFGEVGYDIDINFPCRVCNKPILWNYFFDNSRQQVYQVYAATMKLRNENPTFTEGELTHNLTSMNKRLVYEHDDMDAVVVCNFAVNPASPTPGFTQTGWWYEYYTGDSLLVEDVNMTISMQPGEFRVYTTEKLESPNIISLVGLDEIIASDFIENVYPNPVENSFTLSINQNVAPDHIYILALDGTIIKEIPFTGSTEIIVDISNLSAGKYLVYVEQGGKFAVHNLIKN